MRLTRILSLALAITALPVAAAQAGALRYFIDSEPAGLGSDVVLDFNPSTLTSENETPDSIALFLPAHWRFDRRAVAGECTPAQAAAVRCPAEAQIGYGHTVVHITGYLFPGGETDAVAYVTPFLGRPVDAGDPASIVLQVEILGIGPLIDAVNRYVKIPIKSKYSITGRVIPLHSGPYGLEAQFSGFPGGITVPAPLKAVGVTVTDTRFKLLIGAVRRVVKNITDHVKAPTLTGGTQTLSIPDHEQVGYHLLRKGSPCPTSKAWAYQLEVGFPGAAQDIAGSMSCTK